MVADFAAASAGVDVAKLRCANGPCGAAQVGGFRRWQAAVNVSGCRYWSVQIGPFPPVALSVPLGISNKCDRLPLSSGGVQVSAQWCLTGAGLWLTVYILNPFPLRKISNSRINGMILNSSSVLGGTGFPFSIIE